MIAYIAIGVGMATLRRVDRKYHARCCSDFVLPAGAVVSAARQFRAPCPPALRRQSGRRRPR